MIVATHPEHYPSVLELVEKKLIRKTQILLLYMPDFRNSMYFQKNYDFPPVILCSAAFDGLLARIFMEALGAYNYDYKYSISKRALFFEKIGSFDYTEGFFSLAQLKKNLLNGRESRVIYYYRDLRDVFIHKFYHSKDNSNAIRNYIDGLSDLQALKNIIKGFHYNDGPEKHYYRSVSEEGKEMLRWFRHSNCYKIKHEDLTNDNIVDSIGDILHFVGIPSSSLFIQHAIQSANNILGRETFQLPKRSWENIFDNELRDMFKSEAGDFLIQMGYEKDTNW
jgi:hypothetical protein